MIIDAWAQPSLGSLSRLVPEVAALFAKSGTAEALTRTLSPADTVALMDQAGVDTLMLAAWHRPGQPIITNDQVAEFTTAFPDRFAGVATVDLADPVKAVQELRRAVRQLGFKALRIVPWLWKLPPNDRLYYPLYVACVELGVPFCTQVGHTGPLMPSETGRPIPYLDDVALTFPDLVIVGGHIGFPWTEEMLGLAWKHANVYIDTSAWLPRYYPLALRHAMGSFLKKKILFGTNFPQLPFEKCVQQARELGLPPEAESLFLGENARRIFRLGN